MQNARNAKFALLIAVLLGPSLVLAQQQGTNGAPAKASTAPKHPEKAHKPAAVPGTPAANPVQRHENIDQRREFREQRHENIDQHREFQNRRLERTGVREDIRGSRDINRGAALIREGQKIGGKEGAALEQQGAAMEQRGERDIKKGDAMLNRANQQMMPIPQRTSPPQPEPITKHSEFIWDHRPAPSPEVDDRGVHIDARPVTRAPDARMILDDSKWANTLSRLEKEELTPGDHHWHYEAGMQYSHYMDRNGDHWFGFYHDSSYYWIRHHLGRYWWRDEGKNQWNYWHDGSWWSQDPHSSKATAVPPETNQQPVGPGSTSFANPPVAMPPSQGPSSMNQTDSQSSSGDSGESNPSDSSGSTQNQSDSSTTSN